MFVESILNATEVRANFGSFIDDVIRHKPQFVKRNRDVIASFSVQQLKQLLEAYEFTIEFEEKNGVFTGSIEQIEDIECEAESLRELRKDLAEQLVDYAHQYYDSYSEYNAAPNRKSHAPYILRVLLYNDVSEVAKLLLI
ncbi:hypothetical protein [Paenibacillus sp. FSL L8-0333]|uniref:hypothetical protein n=1 Tax=unclassified Paenibacillus TaxID=185978 RepID=UPI0030D61CFB